LRHEVGQIVSAANHEVSGCSDWDGKMAAIGHISGQNFQGKTIPVVTTFDPD